MAKQSKFTCEKYLFVYMFTEHIVFKYLEIKYWFFLKTKPVHLGPL